MRYILVDTPETYNGVEPFGPEATEANKILVAGKTVQLEKDVSETDRYGRLLRYVYVGGIMVNEELLRQGFAQVATYPPDIKYVDRFLAIQQEARETEQGLWGAATVTPPPPVVAGNPVVITHVDKRAEYVDIKNNGSQAIDLGGWMLRSERGSQDCWLSGVLQPGTALTIWAMAKDVGQGGFNCGFGSNIWNNSKSDPAVLFNQNGEEVSRSPQ